MTKVPKTSDVDLRVLVTRTLLANGTPREAIRHEITLDSSSSDGRADIVVALDRKLTGIEIKSGKDKLDRLETQRGQYRRRFDSLCLVVDAAHCPEADKASWRARSWGYDLRFGDVALVARGEDGNPAFVSHQVPASLPWLPPQPWSRPVAATNYQAPASMLSLLWRNEVYELARKLVEDGSIAPTGTGTRSCLIPALAENVPIAKLRPLIAQALRSRPLNRWEEAFWAEFDAMATQAQESSPTISVDEGATA